MLLSDFQVKALGVPFVAGGRDYSGWDCWGLVYCAFRDVFNDPLPSYSEHYDGKLSYREMERLVNGDKTEWVEVEKPESGDVSLYRVGKFRSHISLVLPNNRMLHCEQELGTVSESLDGIIWGGRHVGYFRHSR